MAELKHIGEVEQIVEVRENDNLIGERDGRAVRIPTNKVIPATIPSVQTAQVGQTVVVKAVDENGKPTEWEAADAGSQADWNEMDESNMAFVKNRTHWAETEYSIQWEWDGSTEGRTVVEFPNGGICVYISDITDPAVLIGAVCTFDVNGSKTSVTFGNGDFEQIAESFYAGRSPFGIATNDNVEFNGAIFPKAGLYYSIANENTDVFSLTITKETVHQLDPKFIPNAGGGVTVFHINDADSCAYFGYVGDDSKPMTATQFTEAFYSGVLILDRENSEAHHIIGYYINSRSGALTPETHYGDFNITFAPED